MESATDTPVAKKAKVSRPKRVSMTKDRFEQAVSDAAKQAAAQTEARLMALLKETRAELGSDAVSATANGDMDMVRKLALAIGEISDQTGNRMIVPPAELEARSKAREEMETAILEAHAKGMVATYELRGTVYLDETLIAATYVDNNRVRRVQAIDWDGVPNELMAPVNETAKIIFRLFKRSIGGNTAEAKVPYKKAAERAGLHVHGQKTARDVAPEVSQPRGPGNGLNIHRQMPPGAVEDVRVLGTVAPAARQLAA